MYCSKTKRIDNTLVFQNTLLRSSDCNAIDSEFTTAYNLFHGTMICPFQRRQHKSNTQRIDVLRSKVCDIEWSETRCFDIECSDQILFEVKTPSVLTKYPRAFCQIPFSKDEINELSVLIDTTQKKRVVSWQTINEYGHCNYIFMNKSFERESQSKYKMLCTRFVKCLRCKKSKVSIYKRQSQCFVYCNQCKTQIYVMYCKM